MGTAQMGRGNEKSPDKWLQELAPDTIFAFYGFNESFRGPEGVASYKEELSAYLKHLQNSKFKGKAPQIVLFSPIAFQDVSRIYNTPVGTEQNANLKLYTAAMKEVADALQVRFVDLYQPTAEWFRGNEVLTVDGASLNEAGYKKLGSLIAQSLYGDAKFTSSEFEALRKLVKDKNWVWHNDYKIPNGVHVYGTRFRRYGQQNYPDERKKLRQMVINRDKAIHAYLRGKNFDLVAADAATHPLPPVKTSFKRKPSGYLYGDEAVKSIVTPKDYQVELFASEKDFPLLENAARRRTPQDSRSRLRLNHHRGRLPFRCHRLHRHSHLPGGGRRHQTHPQERRSPCSMTKTTEAGTRCSTSAPTASTGSRASSTPCGRAEWIT